ncbi:MAG: hypothetical protein ACTHVX_08100 [Candidatus Corynebacterium faecigallinarum]
MNARHAPWPDRARGASVSDGLASVVPLPLLNAVENTARSASRRGSDGGGDSDGEAGNDTNDTNDEDVTLLLLAEHHRPGEGYFTRALGVNSAMSVAETVRAVLIAFSWPGAVRMLQDAGDTVVGGAVSGSAAMRPTTASAASSAASSRVTSPPDGVAWAVRARRRDRLRVYSRTAAPIATPLREALGRDGTATLVADGAVFSVTTAGSMTRDDHTPEAVCLAGDFIPEQGVRTGDGRQDGASGIPRDVDLAAVNVTLTGEETVEQILAGITPELRDLLLAGDLYEFTPLLQALDLERPAQVSDGIQSVLSTLPAETTPVGRAAAWARIVALSTLSDRAASDEISEMLMAALGFTRADADLAPDVGKLSSDPLDAAEIRQLSAATGHVLATCGADVWGQRDATVSGVTPLVRRCSLVERLEMYRYLLQRRDCHADDADDADDGGGGADGAADVPGGRP